MRVLHLGAGNMFGGIETLLVTLARDRDLCPNMQPEFGVCFEGRLSDELRATGVPVHNLGNVRFSRPWTVWTARKNLRRVIAERSPNLVIIHSGWPYAVFAPAVRRTKTRLIFWGHARHNPDHWVDRKASRVSPDLVIANSRFTAAGLSSLFPETAVEALYAPARFPAPVVEQRSRLRAQMQVDEKVVAILMVARMEALKGHRTLLEALSRLRGREDWTCWIVGAGQRPDEIQYENELHQMSERLGLSTRVKWLGQRVDVPDWLAAADIYCQPNSMPDSFGLTFIEAMMAGLPVVTSRLGGAIEIVDSNYGVLVEPNNPVELADALEGLIGSPQKRNDFRKLGEERAKMLCDPAVRFRQLEEIVERVAVSNV